MTIFINGNRLQTFNFSGGECHLTVSQQEISDKTEILAYLKNSDDIMCLMLSVDAIRRINSHTEIDLIIPYFPYARQDRVCNKGEPLSVKVMANLINFLSCNKVTVYDPHSDVTPALLDNCKIVSMSEILIETSLAHEIREKELILISPDTGAEKKVREVAKNLAQSKNEIDFICASKIRETSTGKIIQTKIQGDFNKKDFIILDDICDGGRTFIELSKILYEQGAKNVYLYVTHGIFSNGLNLLKDYFKHIYCYHTILNESELDQGFLTVLNKKN